MADVFISYKREEKHLAQRLHDALEQFGFSVWFDVDLLSGDEFRPVIKEMIDKCSAVVVLWSPLSVSSQFVIDEAGYAQRNDKLCPAMLEPCELPFGFGGAHADSLEGWDGQLRHDGFNRFLGSIERKTGKEARLGSSTPETARQRAEITAFQAAAKLHSVAAWNTFLKDYPGTSFRRFIESQMGELEGAAPVAASPDPPPPVSPAVPSEEFPEPEVSTSERVSFDPNRYVFISHPNSVDPDIVRILARGLIDAGMPVWVFNPSDFDFNPEEFVSMNWQKPGGNHFEQAIEAVQRASCVVMLTGRTTGAGGFQTKELAAAVLANTEMVAAIVDDLPFNELPDGLSDRYVPPIDADRLRSGHLLPMLVSDILDAAAREAKRRELPIVQYPRNESVSRHRKRLKRVLRTGLLLAAISAAIAALVWAFGFFGASDHHASLSPLNAAAGNPQSESTTETEDFSQVYEFRDCHKCPEIVVVPSGSFRMGSPDGEAEPANDEGPLRTVRIGYQFAVGRYEVTWAEWEACVADGGCKNGPVLAAGGDNGWEWTEDCYQDSYSGALTDGSARVVSNCSQRVLRGGSRYNLPQNLRSASRFKLNPTNRNKFLGFRVARTL